ncbi:MAG: sigma factor-like helix-turn-helix DNA-binding protein [bacterium]|jgi:RNA polymerase sigma factor (sigma-70 family)
MGEELLRRTETLLAAYYRQEEEAAFYQDALAAVEGQIEGINELLAATAELIPSCGLTGTYGAVAAGRSSLPGDPTAKAYSEYERTAEELRMELACLARRRIRLLLGHGEAEARRGAVAAAVGQLTAEEREVLEQRYFYRRSYVVIGAALGMDESTVRYRLRSITARLAARLKIL